MIYPEMINYISSGYRCPRHLGESMTSSELFQPIEEHLKTWEHICAFYETKAEQFQVIIPFLGGGLLKRERCLYVADENTAAEIKAGLLMRGLNVGRYLRSGQLRVLARRPSYLGLPRFDRQEVISWAVSALRQALGEGYSGLRVAVEASWILRDLSSIEDFLWCEAMSNAVFKGLPLKALCQYNAKRFMGDVVLKVLKTHPRVLLGLDLYESQFYESLIPASRETTSPEDFQMLGFD